MSRLVRDVPEAGHYEIQVDGKHAGLTAYRLGQDEIAFVHTEVDDAYAGQGLAKILVTEALDDVRKRGLAVLPYCPFVRGFIAKNADYLDLVPEDRRAEFGLG